jgi:hypothetical protein
VGTENSVAEAAPSGMRFRTSKPPRLRSAEDLVEFILQFPYLPFQSLILVPRHIQRTLLWTNSVGQALQPWRNTTLLFLRATTVAQR